MSVKNRKMSTLEQLNDHLLNEKLRVKDQVLISTYAKSIELNDELSQGNKMLLWMFIARSADKKDGHKIQIGAANAITILNYARTSFSGMNLSHIKIPHANLSNAICCDTKFIGANLCNVDFANSYLGGADMTSSQLGNVQFGLLPSMIQNSTIKHLSLSGDKKVLVSGNSNGEVQLYSTANLTQPYIQLSQPSINTISVDMNGKYLAILTLDSRINIWDVNQKTVIATRNYAPYEAYCLSPNGKILALYNRVHLIELWNIVGLKSQFKMTISHPYLDLKYDHDWNIKIIVWHHNLIYCLFKSGVAILKYTSESLVPFDFVNVPRVECIEASLDTKWLAVAWGSERFKLSLYANNTETYRAYAEFETIDKIQYIRYDSDNRNVIGFTSNILYILNIESKIFYKHHLFSNIRCPQIDAANVAYYLQRDNTVYVRIIDQFLRNSYILVLSYLNPNRELLKKIFDTPYFTDNDMREAEKTLIYNNNGSAVAFRDGAIYVFEVENLRLRLHAVSPHTEESSDTKLVLNHDASLLASSGHRGVCVWDISLEDKPVVFCSKQQTPVRLLSFSSYDRMFVYRDNHDIVAVHNLNNHNDILLEKDEGVVYFGGFVSKDVVLTCSRYGTITLLNIVDNSRIINKLSDIESTQRSKSVNFMDIGCSCYTFSNDNKLFSVGYTVNYTLSTVVVLSCTDLKLVLYKNIPNQSSSVGIDDLKLSVSNNYILVAANLSISVYSLQTGQLHQVIACFSDTPYINQLTAKNMIVKYGGDQDTYYHFLVHDGDPFTARLSGLSTTIGTYLKDANLKDALSISSNNTRVLRENGARNVPEVIS